MTAEPDALPQEDAEQRAEKLEKELIEDISSKLGNKCQECGGTGRIEIPFALHVLACCQRCGGTGEAMGNPGIGNFLNRDHDEAGRHERRNMELMAGAQHRCPICGCRGEHGCQGMQHWHGCKARDGGDCSCLYDERAKRWAEYRSAGTAPLRRMAMQQLMNIAKDAESRIGT
jgi:hypothetical protein